MRKIQIVLIFLFLSTKFALAATSSTEAQQYVGTLHFSTVYSGLKKFGSPSDLWTDDCSVQLRLNGTNIVGESICSWDPGYCPKDTYTSEASVTISGNKATLNLKRTTSQFYCNDTTTGWWFKSQNIGDTTVYSFDVSSGNPVLIVASCSVSVNEICAPPPTISASFTPSNSIPIIKDVNPKSAALNQPTIFTVTGSNLVYGMGFTISDCEYSNSEINDGNTFERYFECTPRGVSGVKKGLLKTSPRGNTIHEFDINIYDDAAQSVSEGYIAGTVDEMEIFVKINPAKEDIGKQGKVFLLAEIDGSLFFHNGSSFVRPNGNTYPPFYSGVLGASIKPSQDSFSTTAKSWFADWIDGISLYKGPFPEGAKIKLSVASGADETKVINNLRTKSTKTLIIDDSALSNGGKGAGDQNADGKIAYPASNAPIKSSSVNLLVPENGSSTEIDSAFEWGAANGALKYQIVFSETAFPLDTDDGIFCRSCVVNTSQNKTRFAAWFPQDEDVSKTYVEKFLPGQKYYWRVRPLFASGVRGQWSETRSFTVKGQQQILGTPLQLADGNIAGDTKGWVKWEGEGAFLDSYLGISAYQNNITMSAGFQCSELAARFLHDIYNISVKNKKNEDDVSLLQRKGAKFAREYDGKLSFVTLNGLKTNVALTYFSNGSTQPPTNGSFISQYSPASVGHITVVKKVEPVDESTLTVYLFEQNWIWSSGKKIAHSRKMTFTKSKDGTWSGSDGVNSAVGWLVPIVR